MNTSRSGARLKTENPSKNVLMHMNVRLVDVHDGVQMNLYENRARNSYAQRVIYGGCKTIAGKKKTECSGTVIIIFFVIQLLLLITRSFLLLVLFTK